MEVCKDRCASWVKKSLRNLFLPRLGVTWINCIYCIPVSLSNNTSKGGYLLGTPSHTKSRVAFFLMFRNVTETSWNQKGDDVPQRKMLEKLLEIWRICGKILGFYLDLLETVHPMTLNVWFVYLIIFWTVSGVNVGKYTILWLFGVCF